MSAVSARGPWTGVSPRFAVAMIAIVSFHVRILHVFSYFRFPTSDETHYYAAAVDKLTFARFLTPDGFMFFPAGYSFFLKPFFLVFEGDGAFRAAQVTQAALGAWTCVLLYRLGRKLHSRLAGLSACFLAAFYPHLLFYSSVFMSEVLFAPLYLYALLCLLHARERGAGSLYLAGLVCGAAALVRPVAATLAPAVLHACRRAGRPPGRAALSLAIFLSGLLTILGPWVLRNWIAYGHFVLIAPNDGFNLFIGNHPEAAGRFTMPAAEGLDPWLDRRAHYIEALDFALTDPVGLLFVVFGLKWDAFWEFHQPWPLATSNPQLFDGEHFFPLVSWRIVLFLGSLGAGVLMARGRAGWWITPAVFAAYLAFYLVFFGNSRFRHPSESFFVLWSGVLVAALARRIPVLAGVDARRWALGICGLLVAVLAQSALDAAATRSVLSDPDSLLATGCSFGVDPTISDQPLFGAALIPVDRSRERYLRLEVEIRREGPAVHPSNLAQLRITFFDASGAPVYPSESAAYFLETLRANRRENLHMKAQIPPGAMACRVALSPSVAFQERVEVVRSTLRYSRGNDLALEFLFPYLRWGE